MVLQRFYRSRPPLPLFWGLLLAFMVEVVFLAGALSWISIRHGERTAANAMDTLGRWTAVLVKEKVKNHFERSELLLKVNQAATQTGQLDLRVTGRASQQNLQSLFLRQVSLTPAVRSLYYTDLQGNLLQVEQGPPAKLSLRTPETAPNWSVYRLTEAGERVGPVQQLFDPRKRLWYQATLDRKQLTWSQVYRFKDPQILGLTVSVPVWDANQQIQGILSVDVSLEEISEFLKGLELRHRSQVAIIQGDGTVIATSSGDRRASEDDDAARPLADVTDPWLRAAGRWFQKHLPQNGAADAAVSAALSAADGESLLVQTLPLRSQRGMDWRLVVVAPASEFRGAMDQINRDTMALMVGAIALAVVSSLWLARRLARPIQGVSQAAETIANGNLRVQVPPSAIAEANTLANAFNRMAVQLLHTFNAWEETNQHLEREVEERTAAARQSEEKFAKIFRSSPNPIAISTLAEGRILDANDCFFEMVQYPAQEVVGRTAQALDLWLRWSDREAIISDLTQYGLVQGREIVFQNRSGDRHTLLISAELATLDNQRCILWAGNDITEQKQSEIDLREKEEYLRSILDSIPQHVFWKDVDLNFLGCNRNWAEAAGLSDPVEVIGKTDYDLIPDPDAATDFRVQDRTIIETGEAVWHLIAPKQKAGPHGETRWLDISKIPIHGANGEIIGILGVIDDITLRKQAEDALQLEKERSECLLLNVLPQAIADQLKESASLNNPAVNSKPIAHHYDDVSILFADIVGFTGLSAQLTPIELVDWLNRLFSEFDRLADQYRLEKIKTIGDAYMVAGGLPTPMPDSAVAIAHMALDMLDTIQVLEPEFMATFNRPLNIRIGINSGPVIAGVIGIKKFIYDLWGDTVNIASRMESQGAPGKIQITAATYRALTDQFRLDYRGEIQVKGRGPMKTYWLQGRQPLSPSPFPFPANNATTNNI